MITLGSGPLADLMLPHSSIQPVHARLLLRRGRLLLVGTASGARAVRDMVRTNWKEICNDRSLSPFMSPQAPHRPITTEERIVER